MAKKSAVERNLKRQRLSKQFAGRRAKLKEIVMNKETTPEARFDAVVKLSRLPKNSAKNRIRNRCEVTGKPRGYFRKFGICRNVLRELSSIGQVPGVIKSSW
ncbi:MAG: 30S ribosomal protein S14 [Rickettsiales bacterium]|nr:30S ribosomal protein S14 [Rickettsiales bacterium]